MSQDIWGTINPLVTSGTTLAALLTEFKNAFVSGFSGTSRPAGITAGGWWVDTTNSASPNFYYSFKLWTGTVDVEVFRININNNFGGAISADSELDITQISADTTGPILGLFKQRIATNGQLLDGDVVGEIQLIGRTNTGTDPVVANLKWTSSDSETASVFGGYLSIYSTPDASATLTEHLRLITGLVETVVPHKINSQRLVSQDVSTTATIAALDASKILVEFTGSTTTSVKGINAGQASQEITLHNRSSAVVTLSNQNVSATAINRFKLPSSLDYILNPDCSVTLFYDVTDTRWKIKSTERFSFTKTVRQFRGLINDWVCPTGVSRLLLTPYKQRLMSHPRQRSMLDVYGNVYSWGEGVQGSNGDGTVVSKSSPVAVLGGISFSRLPFGGANSTSNANVLALDKTGKAYAWGINSVGELGVGDVINRSSPVAVLGGLRFRTVFNQVKGNYGITTDGKAYAWGQPATGTISGTNSVASSPVAVLGGFSFDSFVGTGPNQQDNAGALGVDGTAYVWGRFMSKGGAGDGTADQITGIKSSPVAVIGGLTFKRFHLGISALTNTFGIALTKDGAAYAWGDGQNGVLGTGNTTAKSSPVAVIGGLTFMDLYLAKWNGNAQNDSIFGLLEDGTLYAWGNNANGQLGVGDVTNRSSPTAVATTVKFRDICAGSGLTYGIATDGSMYAWGNNPNGELGVGDRIPRSSPVAVLGGIKFAQFINEGLLANSSMTSVAEDGTLYSWGSNGFGTLGLGDISPRSSPVAVIGGFGYDNRWALDVIAIPVTAGNTYRILLPQLGPASFGSVPIGIGIEKVTLEFDTQGDS